MSEGVMRNGNFREADYMRGRGSGARIGQQYSSQNGHSGDYVPHQRGRRKHSKSGQVDEDSDSEEGGFGSGLGHGKTILVIAIVVGCFAVLWPKIFYPMLFGEVPVPHKTDDEVPSSRGSFPEHPSMKERGRMGAHPSMQGQGRPMPGPGGRIPPPPPAKTIDKEWEGMGPRPGMRPTMGGPGIQPQQPKGGGTMGVLMPIYTIGIIIFFVYTAVKIMFKNKDPEEEEEEEKKNKKYNGVDNEGKYDEEYYNNYIKQYKMQQDDLSVEKHQEDAKSRPEEKPHKSQPNENNKGNVIFNEEINDENSTDYEENENEEESVKQRNDILNSGSSDIENKDKNITENTELPDEVSQDSPVPQNESPSQSKDRAEGVSSKASRGDKVNPQNGSNSQASAEMDPRDIEISLLRTRLEETEKSMEKIMMHMGSLTNKLMAQQTMHNMNGGCCHQDQDQEAECNGCSQDEEDD